MMSDSSFMTNPVDVLVKLFNEFKVLTLAITIGAIVGMLILKDKLSNIPFIALLAIIGIALTWTDLFANAKDLCEYTGSDP